MRPDAEIQALKERIALMNAQLQQQDRVINSLVTVQGTIQEALEAMHHTTQCLESSGAALNGIVQTQSTNITFVTLYVYWLSHIMQEFENIVPVGTVDLILNTIEENADPSEASFYSMFDALRTPHAA